jgi:hypothetical protein
VGQQVGVFGREVVGGELLGREGNPDEVNLAAEVISPGDHILHGRGEHGLATGVIVADVEHDQRAHLDGALGCLVLGRDAVEPRRGESSLLRP